MRGTGFEPAVSNLQRQALAGQGTQGGTQNMSDPDLAKVVKAWPSLAPAIKAAINALVNHQH
jgi:hypothetical protein